MNKALSLSLSLSNKQGIAFAPFFFRDGDVYYYVYYYDGDHDAKNKKEEPDMADKAEMGQVRSGVDEKTRECVLCADLYNTRGVVCRKRL